MIPAPSQRRRRSTIRSGSPGTSGADLVSSWSNRPKGVGVDASAWSFSRGQTEQEFTMTLISRTPERIVWNEKGRLIVELGSESPSVDELSAIAGQAVAERVAELRR